MVSKNDKNTGLDYIWRLEQSHVKILGRWSPQSHSSLWRSLEDSILFHRICLPKRPESRSQKQKSSSCDLSSHGKCLQREIKNSKRSSTNRYCKKQAHESYFSNACIQALHCGGQEEKGPLSPAPLVRQPEPSAENPLHPQRVDLLLQCLRHVSRWTYNQPSDCSQWWDKGVQHPWKTSYLHMQSNVKIIFLNVVWTLGTDVHELTKHISS